MSDQALVVQEGEVLDQPTLVELRETMIREDAAVEAIFGRALVTALPHAIRAGEALLTAREMLVGGFRRWTDANLPRNLRSGRRTPRRDDMKRTALKPHATKACAGCTECGMALDDAGEFHPYVFCLLKKAGRDPWEDLLWLNEQLGVDVTHWPKRPPLVRNLRPAVTA